MISKIKNLDIKKLHFCFVFKSRFGKPKDEIEKFTKHNEMYRLGLFFKKSKIVSTKNISDVNNWGKNLINQYMLGLDLIMIKFWFTLDKSGAHFEIDEEKK